MKSKLQKKNKEQIYKKCQRKTTNKTQKPKALREGKTLRKTKENQTPDDGNTIDHAKTKSNIHQKNEL